MMVGIKRDYDVDNDRDGKDCDFSDSGDDGAENNVIQLSSTLVVRCSEDRRSFYWVGAKLDIGDLHISEEHLDTWSNQWFEVQPIEATLGIEIEAPLILSHWISPSPPVFRPRSTGPNKVMPWKTGRWMDINGAGFYGKADKSSW